MLPPVLPLLLLLLLTGHVVPELPLPDDPLPEDPFAGMGLEEARKVFRSRLHYPPELEAELHNLGYGAVSVPEPPADLFRVIHYRAPEGQTAALLTPNPGDGRRRPAVLWAHSGWGGLDRWMWDAAGWPDPLVDHRIPRVFIDAGFVVMAPSWRGENLNPGRFELYFGEVDDLLAALDHLQSLPWVDEDRIYLVGYSQGATLVTLAAEITDAFCAAFAIGPTLDVEAEVKALGEAASFVPFDRNDDLEGMLRSPMPWALGIRRPTFAFEGAEGATDEALWLQDGEAMTKLARAGNVPFRSFGVKGYNHQTVLLPMSRFITGLIARDADPRSDPLLQVDAIGADLEAFLNRPAPAALALDDVARGSDVGPHSDHDDDSVRDGDGEDGGAGDDPDAWRPRDDL